ncbi:MAG: FtsX-like permease family protein [Myxococcota bacterium]
MDLRRVFRVVGSNIRRNKRSFVLSSVGIVVGVGTFTFFVALGMGIQSGVLNRIYPVNQIEVEPATVGVVGLQETVVDPEMLGPEMVETLSELPRVTAVYPKMRSRLQARLWGGKSMFGYNMRTEAFFDGLEPTLVHDELQDRERVEDKRARQALEDDIACKRDEECPLGQECGEDGVCGHIEYWQRFRDHGVAVPCGEEGETRFCPEGRECLAGRCRTPCPPEGGCGGGEACVPSPDCGGEGDCPGICLPTCDVDGDCPETHVCESGPDGAGVCTRMRCRLESVQAQFSDRPREVSGTVVGRCANKVDPSSPACEPMRCPGGSYCATRNVNTDRGWCEDPLPVVLNPFLIEVFNSSVASSLGLQPLDGTEAILGLRFRMHLGGSFFTADLPRDKQQVKLAEIAGFSSKALEFGVTMPLPYVKLFNTHFKGREAASTYNTFILETEGNEDVSALIAELEDRGFSLSRRSENARKAADVLFILTVVFTFISFVIMGVAAVNITHTFLTIITERRYEIGIMRAVGATRADIRRLILVEASAIGVFGALVGEGLSYAFSRLVNVAAAEYLEGVPFKPEDFFVYDFGALAGAVAFALVFCVIGALLPARRASRLDPARILAT